MSFSYDFYDILKIMVRYCISNVLYNIRKNQRKEDGECYQLRDFALQNLFLNKGFFKKKKLVKY